MRGNTAIMLLLLEAGAEVDAVTIKNDTALIFAAQKSQTEAAKLLLKKGARTDIKNDWGKTALDEARKAGATEIVALLEKAAGAAPQPAEPTRKAP